ncbi:MAG: hypothetical protein P4L11_02280 [Geothrix sp.]|nr:hypothetical protein [Geothrix sp.]
MSPASEHPTPPEILGLAPMAHRIMRGENLGHLRWNLEARVAEDPSDAAAWLDLGTLLELCFYKDEGLACQARALALNKVFRVPSPGATTGLRLLMFAGPGDIMANVPAQFLLVGSDVSLDLVFVEPGQPLPELPAHDLALVGIGESDANRPLLEQLRRDLAGHPVPVLLDPVKVQALARDRLWRLLEGVPGLLIPPTVRAALSDLKALAEGRRALEELLPGGVFPVLLRPLDSHGGKGLARLSGPEELAQYLAQANGGEFYLSRFIDYRGAGGLHRKLRIALIDGRAYTCHMAVAEHWMLHYLNAGMDGDPAKREEEARLFATFDTDFAVRHAGALAALCARADLEYFAIDCAETRDGELLIFEADTAMVVHDMDPPALYPYKGPQMQKVFRAFRDLLGRAAGRERQGA